MHHLYWTGTPMAVPAVGAGPFGCLINPLLALFFLRLFAGWRTAAVTAPVTTREHPAA